MTGSDLKYALLNRIRNVLICNYILADINANAFKKLKMFCFELRRSMKTSPYCHQNQHL